MYLENTTDENIFIAAGIFVPARGTLSVSLEMHDMVSTSPLVADYVKAGELVVHGAPVSETTAETVVEVVAPDVPPKPAGKAAGDK